MRYRLMASYLGASYQAAIGPTDCDVTLFAAPPPPEEHGFSPVPGGIWRKYVRVDELDALWESRPIGSYHGEPCLVLDDLGDRLHIVYLGMDERRASQLGYWQVDKGVFEVVVARHEVTDLAEERHEFPIALLLSAQPRALNAGGPQQAPAGLRPQPSGGLAGGVASAVVPGPAGRQPLPRSSQGPMPQPAQGYQVAALSPTVSPPAVSPPPVPTPTAQPQQAVAPQQLPHAQQPAAVVAWHGSPAGDGNGTWYQTADLGPQQNGTVQNGTVQNGNGQNGNGQNGNGQNGMQGTQPPPGRGLGYQQAPPQQTVALAQPSLMRPIQQPQQQPPQFAQQAQAAPVMTTSPLAAPVTRSAAPGGSADLATTGPLPPAPQAPPAPQTDQADQASSAGGLTAGGALSKLTGAVRGRRAARKPRLAMSAIFADLVDLAHIPRSAYAVDDEVTGAMCLFKTEGGYEVFSCAQDARHEVRFFEEEEAAYFYLFGVLAAEALRNGRLSPRQG